MFQIIILNLLLTLAYLAVAQNPHTPPRRLLPSNYQDLPLNV